MKSNKLWIKLLVTLFIQIQMIAMEPTWYESNDGKRYLIDTEEKYNWYQAWNECARYDAQLIAIESEEKNHILMKLLKNVNDKNKNLWIGGTVFYDKLSYYWSVNEQPFTFTNWATADVGEVAMKKLCVYLMRHRKNYPWNIASCDAHEFGFICEEMAISQEVRESIKENQSSKGSMYNGSIFGLIG